MLTVYTANQKTDELGKFIKREETIPISREEQIEAIKKAKKGDQEARDLIIKTNIRLVASIACKYKGRGVEYEDMVQDGVIGLIKAIEMFEPDKGYAFSTYATWWIKQTILRSIDNNGRTIRIPAYVMHQINRYHRILTEYQIKHGRDPTKEEAAEELHLSKNEMCLVSEHEQDVSSLDIPIGDEGDANLIDFIKTQEADPYESVEDAVFRESINNVIDSCLSKREKEIIYMRFGFIDGNSMTFQEISDRYGLSRERIRQIQNSAMRKLKYKLISAGIKQAV